MSSLVSLKRSSESNLKVLIAIGGSVKRDGVLNDLGLLFDDSNLRKNFIESVLDFLNQYELDGINLDWHFSREDRVSNERVNLVKLIKEMRNEFNNMAKFSGSQSSLITMTLPSNLRESESFDIPQLDALVDFFCLLTYNYHSAYERSANHHSPLYRSNEISPCSTKADLNSNNSVYMYIKSGASKNKLILGIPTYGKCFGLENSVYHTTGSPTIGPYKSFPCNKESFVPYSKLCPLVLNGSLQRFSPEPCKVGPYVYGQNLKEGNTFWIGYDDEEAVRLKGAYVSRNNLGGISFWALEHDDFRGLCSDTKYPLIKAASKGLINYEYVCRPEIQEDYSLDILTLNIMNAKYIVQNVARGAYNLKNSMNTTKSIFSTKNHTRQITIKGMQKDVYNPYQLASHNIYTGIWGSINFVVGVLGNILTLVAIPHASSKRRHELHKNWYTSTIFILNLAVFDLGFCIFGMTHDVLFNLGIGWPFGNIACKVFNFLGPVFAYGDWYSLGLIALTRALFITKPTEWDSFCNKPRRVFAVLIGMCSFNIILLIPRFYSQGKQYIYDEYSDICQYVDMEADKIFNNEYILSILPRIPHYVAFSLTIITIIISYFNVWWHVRKSRKNIERADTLKCTITSIQSVKMNSRQNFNRINNSFTTIEPSNN